MQKFNIHPKVRRVFKKYKVGITLINKSANFLTSVSRASMSVQEQLGQRICTAYTNSPSRQSCADTLHIVMAVCAHKCEHAKTDICQMAAFQRLQRFTEHGGTSMLNVAA